jgi:acetoin utilization deacetylase AcuC-like enzyme
MKAFYSDTFVLPLPEGYRFPMAKYRLVRERLVEEGVLAPEDLHVPDAVSWDDLRRPRRRLREAVATGHSGVAQRRIGFVVADDGRAVAEVRRRNAGRGSRSAGGGRRSRRYGSVHLGNLAGGTHHAFRDRGKGSVSSTTSR